LDILGDERQSRRVAGTGNVNFRAANRTAHYRITCIGHPAVASF
jgi:hypothetical protein